jgi:hypothetical protein
VFIKASSPADAPQVTPGTAPLDVTNDNETAVTYGGKIATYVRVEIVGNVMRVTTRQGPDYEELVAQGNAGYITAPFLGVFSGAGAGSEDQDSAQVATQSQAGGQTLPGTNAVLGQGQNQDGRDRAATWTAVNGRSDAVTTDIPILPGTTSASGCLVYTDTQNGQSDMPYVAASWTVDGQGNVTFAPLDPNREGSVEEVNAIIGPMGYHLSHRASSENTGYDMVPGAPAP